MAFLKKMSPGRIIALGFALVILVGALLLMLPISCQPGVQVNFVDALFTSTSAVCVTGLAVVDIGDTFSVFGRTIVAMLIQIGGLGVTSVGVAFILAAGKRVGFKERLLVREALNVDSGKGIVRLVKAVLLVTLSFEVVGVVLSFAVFVQDYPPLSALGISIFHSIAAFNNSGFDILGNFQNMIPYRESVLLNLTTCGLIIFGGLGFLVILDLLKKRSFRKLTFHSQIVVTVTTILIVVGTLLLKATEDITWLDAFFHSVSARTAGFSTCALGEFTDAGLLTLILLMFIGASPGSTGGGIKTSTLFTLTLATRAAATNRPCSMFRRRIPQEVIYKAFIITLLAALVVIVGVFGLSLLEPEYDFIQLLFETVSAFGTVGLSTGITPALGVQSKLLITVIMFIGRLGPLTVASLWGFRPDTKVLYPQETIAIG